MFKNKSGHTRSPLYRTHPVMISRAPLKIPEVLKPAITRPTISRADEFSTPQIKEPSSKTKKKLRKVHYIRKLVSKELEK